MNRDSVTGAPDVAALKTPRATTCDLADGTSSGCAPKRNTTKRQRLPKYEQLVDAFCRGDECGRRAPASLELASPNYREYQEQYYCQAQLPGHNEPCYGCLNTCACLCGRGEATPRAT